MRDDPIDLRTAAAEWRRDIPAEGKAARLRLIGALTMTSHVRHYMVMFFSSLTCAGVPQRLSGY